MLVTEITLCWWRMHLHQLVYVLFVFPLYGCQVHPRPSLYHPTSILFSVQNS